MNRLKLSKLSELSSSGSEFQTVGPHSRTPDSRTCWVDSEAQWDSSCWSATGILMPSVRPSVYLSVHL